MLEPFVPTRAPLPLPGTRLLGLKASSLLELTEAVRRGVRPSSIDQLARHLQTSTRSVLVALEVSESSFFEAKRKKRPLGAEASSRALSIARVVEAAEGYFEDAGLARAWLGRERAEFGGKTPLEYATTAEGADHAVAVLARAAHGVY